MQILDVQSSRPKNELPGYSFEYIAKNERPKQRQPASRQAVNFFRMEKADKEDAGTRTRADVVGFLLCTGLPCMTGLVVATRV